MANIRVQRLQDIEQQALALSQQTLPNVNWGASFISAEGAAALNNFESALRWRGETNLINEWGMMCDPDIADEVVDKLRWHLEDLGDVLEDELAIKMVLAGAGDLPVFIWLYRNNAEDKYGVIALRERDNDVIGSRCYGAATVKIETVKDWATEGRSDDE